jgi:hypothetical protein
MPLMTSNKIDVTAAICAAIFIAVLAVSAYWDRSIRVLHVFESLPYLLAAVLCLRRNKLGYALGLASGVFWLWTAGFLTTFIRNGFERLEMLLRTGSVDRPDILIAVPAAVATAGLALSSVLGYARLPNKSWRDSAALGTAVVLVPGFFIAIFAAFAPQYLQMFRGLVNR